jgi:hypothetical protein
MIDGTPALAKARDMGLVRCVDGVDEATEIIEAHCREWKQRQE